MHRTQPASYVFADFAKFSMLGTQITTIGIASVCLVFSAWNTKTTIGIARFLLCSFCLEHNDHHKNCHFLLRVSCFEHDKCHMYGQVFSSISCLEHNSNHVLPAFMKTVFLFFQALQHAREQGMSAAIFAPGWVLETLGETEFDTNDCRCGDCTTNVWGQWLQMWWLYY